MIPYQAIIYYTTTDTRKTFSCMLTIAKTFKELFTLNLNGTVVSVQYVSSTPVVLHTGLTDQLRRMQIN